MLNNDDMKIFADSLWKYLEPKIRELTGSCIKFYRAEVEQAASNGKIVVKRPFDSVSLSLPYVSSMANAAVGSQVVVFVFGSNNNDANNSVIVGNGSFTQ